MYVSRRGLIRIDSTELGDEPLDLALGELKRVAEADYHPRAIDACLATIAPVLAALAPPLWASLGHRQTIERLLQHGKGTGAAEYLRRQWAACGRKGPRRRSRE
jgi:hypothetical protein